MTTGRQGLHGELADETPGPLPLVDRLRQLAASGFFQMPQPGDGRTPERLDRLAELARDDLPLARLAEAHLDAVTILAEAGRAPLHGALYGVWASDTPQARLEAHKVEGGWELAGTKAFCTGSGIVNRALVTASTGLAVLLVDLPVTNDQIDADYSGWISPAFASTNTATVTFSRHRVGADAVIGPPNWYLERIGFWHGALAPAACWAGGAAGLADRCIDLCRAARDPDPHTLGHLGFLDAASWGLDAALQAAGRAIDDHPTDPELAVDCAYRCRAVVEYLATDIIDHAVRAHGPRLLAFDPWASQHIAELQLYVRQHHGRRDHAVLGRRTCDRSREHHDVVSPSLLHGWVSSASKETSERPWTLEPPTAR